MEKHPSYKLHFFAGKPEAEEACTLCQMTYGQYDLDKANVQVVLGGDGSILEALHQQINMNLNIPIFGLNYGSLGFLANKGNIENLYERITQAEEHKESIVPLKMVATSSLNGQKQIAYAFNEFSFLRSSPQSLHLSLTLRDQDFAGDFDSEGDGVLISTPTGSHAYYTATGGKAFDNTEKDLALRTINSKVLFDFPLTKEVKLGVTTKQAQKRPMMIEGDGQRFEHISRAIISLAPEKRKTLLFEAKRQNQR